MTPKGSSDAPRDRLISFVRRDVLERPVFWAHAADDAPALPADAPAWPLDPSRGQALDALGLLPAISLPSAASMTQQPSHILILPHDPHPEERAALQDDARQRLAELLLSQGDALSLPAPAYRFSVIVPTYSRVAQAMEAVRSVCAQDYAADAYEVLLIYNGTNAQPFQQALEALRSELPDPAPRVRLLSVPMAGVSLARNVGIAAAQGEIICSLDDDCCPRADWLAALDLGWTSMPDAGVIGGQLLLQVPDPIPEAFQPGWEIFWSHLPLTGHQLIRCQDWRSYPWGGNWSARRDTLYRVGGFPLRYGARGQAFAGGEEIAAAAAIALAGYEIVLCPSAIVDHHPAPDRYTLDHVRSTMAASAMLEHRMYRDGLIASASSPFGTMSQLLRASITMSAAWLSGQRDLARDRRLRLRALAHKLRAQLGLSRTAPDKDRS